MVHILYIDNRASVAEAAAGAKKLVDDDKVSALIYGGNSVAETEAIADAV